MRFSFSGKCDVRFWICLTVFGSASFARAEPCEREGLLSHRDLQVVVGDSTLQLVVQQSPVVVRPPASGTRHEVEVRTSLGFVAAATELPYTIRSRVETGHGMVSITRDTHIDQVRAQGDDVRVRAHLTPAAAIGGLVVPCADVVLGREQTDEPSGNERIEIDGTTWRPRGRRLRVHRGPNTRETVEILIARGSRFVFGRATERGAWMKMVWNNSVARVVGWVRKADVRRSERHGWGRTGGYGSAGCMRTGWATGPGLYRGPADIRPGAFVRVSPRGRPWATVRVATGFEVQHLQGEAWVRVLIAPNVMEGGSCGLAHAWVRRSDVTLAP